jgi:hypothetical protein
MTPHKMSFRSDGHLKLAKQSHNPNLIFVGSVDNAVSQMKTNRSHPTEEAIKIGQKLSMSVANLRYLSIRSGNSLFSRKTEDKLFKSIDKLYSSPHQFPDSIPLYVLLQNGSLILSSFIS